MATLESNSASTLTQEFKEYSLGALGEVIQGSCHCLGIVSGQLAVGRMLNMKAGELFKNKKDELARFCRDLADEITATAEQGRKDFDAVSYPRERAAFAELERRDGKGGAND